MPQRLSFFSHSSGLGTTNYCSRYPVKTNTGEKYVVGLDENSDVFFRKYTPGSGWGHRVFLATVNSTSVAVWYDRWSGLSTDLIHVVYGQNTGDHDIKHRSIDTANSDALSAETVVFNGVSGSSGGGLSIARARGGNLLVWGAIDNGIEGGVFKSTDAGATWSTVTINEALANTDQAIMLPGWAADNQDMQLHFWDASANEISLQKYDDSADAWAETSIAGSMNDAAANITNGMPHFAAAVDIANSRNVLVAWSAVDAANADLRCWTVTESAITEVTNVVLNSADDQGLAAIAIDSVNSGHWTVFYAGKSDGSETWHSAVNLYCKETYDSGTTWGAETALLAAVEDIACIHVTPRYAGDWMLQRLTQVQTNVLEGSALMMYGQPRAHMMIGA